MKQRPHVDGWCGENTSYIVNEECATVPATCYILCCIVLIYNTVQNCGFILLGNPTCSEMTKMNK